MTDMLIRDVPDDVIAALETHARRLGLSRSEYVRRKLAQDAAATDSPVNARDSTRIRLRSFSFTYWQYETYHRIGWRASQGNGECAVALAISEVRGIVERN